MTTYTSNDNSRMGKVDTVSCREQGTSAAAGIKVFFLNLFVLLSGIAAAYALLF